MEEIVSVSWKLADWTCRLPGDPTNDVVKFAPLRAAVRPAIELLPAASVKVSGAAPLVTVIVSPIAQPSDVSVVAAVSVLTVPVPVPFASGFNVAVVPVMVAF